MKASRAEAGSKASEEGSVASGTKSGLCSARACFTPTPLTYAWVSHVASTLLNLSSIR
jgi:hypothetical protein